MMQLSRGTGLAAKRYGLLSGLVVGSTLLTACTTFESGNSDSSFSNRVYVGAGALVSDLDPDTSGVPGTSVDDSMSAGGSLALGYDLNHRFTVEGHVASLGDATLEPSGSIDYIVGGISGIVYGFNDRRERSRREGFSVFGRLGVGALSNDSSGVDHDMVNSVHLLAGAGFEYGLENGLGIRAELVAHEEDARYAQLGLVYRFGEASRLRSGSPVIPSESAELPAAPASEVELPETYVAPDPEPVSETVVEPVPVDPVPAVDLDTDNDSVADARDQCPDTAAGLPVDADGCVLFDGVVEGLTFLSGSDELTDEAIAVLADVALALRDYPEVVLTIEAHTDNAGDAVDNLQLSKRRAIAVASFLVDRGISGSRLKPQAYGESRPTASNSTAEGRAANRRVEFVVSR